MPMASWGLWIMSFNWNNAPSWNVCTHRYDLRTFFGATKVFSLKIFESKNTVYKRSRPLSVSHDFGFKLALFQCLYTLFLWAHHNTACTSDNPLEFFFNQVSWEHAWLRLPLAELADFLLLPPTRGERYCKIWFSNTGPEFGQLVIFAWTGPIFPKHTHCNIRLFLTYQLSSRYQVGSRGNL